MNKIISITFILFAVAIAMVGCHTPSTIDPTSESSQLDACLSQIFEICDLEYSNNSNLYNHVNVISRAVQYRIDTTASKVVVKDIGGNNNTLNYIQSLYYPVGGYTVHEYSSNTYEDGSIFLKDDGSFFGLNCSFLKLNIQKSDSPETVRNALEPAISKLINLSEYQLVEITRSSQDNSDFGLYTYKYYNMCHGYHAGFTRVGVRSDGTVSFIWIIDIPVDSTSEVKNIDKALEEEIITTKLNTIYNTEETEYRNHEYRFNPSLLIHNGELCVEYTLSCDIYFKSQNVVKSELCEIVIPVNLLCNNQLSFQLK